MEEKKGRGRPLMYETPEEMQKVIDRYFKRCEGHKKMKPDKSGYICDKYGVPLLFDAKPPTITGLALALGLSGRQALLNYEGREDFVDTVTRAKSRVEEYAETRLFDKDGAAGAKFSLANNFKGWAEKTEGVTVGMTVEEYLKKADGGFEY